jgi:hypothetical protein
MSRPSRFVLFASTGLLLLSSCQSGSSPKYSSAYIYQGIYFGRNFSSSYKQGIRDGCETSRGIYTKSHKLFNNNNDYYNGWFLGRHKCLGLLKIDEEGNLVL